MRKFQTLIVGVVSVFVLVAAPMALVSADQTNPQVESASQKRLLSATAATAEPTCRRLSATNVGGQDIFTGTGNYKMYSGTSWQNVTCADTTFRLRYNERAVVIANVNAESDCQGADASNGQWCQLRATLNGSEGAPVAAEPDSFAFDNVSGGNSYDWQANSMQRAWDIRCRETVGCVYKFAVQTRMHDSTVSSLWLDEVTAHIRVTTGGAAPL